MFVIISDGLLWSKLHEYHSFLQNKLLLLLRVALILEILKRYEVRFHSKIMSSKEPISAIVSWTRKKIGTTLICTYVQCSEW